MRKIRQAAHWHDLPPAGRQPFLQEMPRDGMNGGHLVIGYESHLQNTFTATPASMLAGFFFSSENKSVFRIDSCAVWITLVLLATCFFGSITMRSWWAVD